MSRTLTFKQIDFGADPTEIDCLKHTAVFDLDFKNLIVFDCQKLEHFNSTDIKSLRNQLVGGDLLNDWDVLLDGRWNV